MRRLDQPSRAQFRPGVLPWPLSRPRRSPHPCGGENSCNAAGRRRRIVTGSHFSMTLKICSGNRRAASGSSLGGQLPGRPARPCRRQGSSARRTARDTVRLRRTCARCGKARCLQRRSAAPRWRPPACRHWYGLSACAPRPPSPSAVAKSPVSSRLAHSDPALEHPAP